MMTQWWTNLSDRERLLLTGLGGFLGVMILVLGILAPILTFHANAREDFSDALRTREMVARAAIAAESDPELSQALRSVLTASAQSNGIVLQRIGVPQGNTIDITVASGSIERLARWLADLEARYDVYLGEGGIRPAANGEGVTGRLTMVAGT